MNQSPNTHHQHPISRRARVRQATDRFVRQWEEKQHPRIEDYVADFAEADRKLLLRELIGVEIALRVKVGEDVDLHQYKDRFSGDSEIVDSVVEFLKQGNTEIDQTTVPSTIGRHDDSQPYEDGVAALSSEPPTAIGRYEILRVLGRGGFATVYLAHDPDLDREVALKVPRLDRFAGEADLESFVDEARRAAQLDHPGIVSVLDVQREPGLVYIVQPFLAGGDLAQHTLSNRLPPRDVTELMVAIAAAVGYAHQRQYIHFDLKPANILLDQEGHPHVADFGLAVHESMQSDKEGQVFGTFAYMSPAQARGEVHRLDGRADIWSLGVIFYELLTGRRPFTGRTREELLDQIENHEPKPPRMIDPTLPQELSRICLACLAKRDTDRYPSTADLIDDLNHWLEGTSTSHDEDGSNRKSKTTDVRVIPQGLRSFEAEHADFYLQLLPGPHDREGLPKQVRFWKTQIEETDPDETFPVGMMYGPSGCGKSSLVKSGLLPRLHDNVIPIYVESTTTDTELRLSKALRKRFTELPEEASLSELVAVLRRRGGPHGQKVLIVLDQFEQWLHANSSIPSSQLVSALRHCDGGRVQCLVMVRDDFWMSATRFMQAIEVPLAEAHNSAAVDLFDKDHATKVLISFGRAYRKLPEPPSEPSEPQMQFLRQAVDGLVEDDKIVCVRLAVFAEMMRGRAWTEESLAEVGGTRGIGVTFLDENFTARTAPPLHRLHQDAVRSVLRELLPEQGLDIKGQMKSRQQLLDASGYGKRIEDFKPLLNILDSEVRLITPTEPDGSIDRDESPSQREATQYYQLTHDFLVPSIRQWLTQKQQETRQGRAEIKLAERSSLWNAQPESRQLPSFSEWISILLHTTSKQWSASERKMMLAAGRFQARRLLSLAAIIAVIVMAGFGISNRIRQDRAANETRQFVDRVLVADLSKLPSVKDNQRVDQSMVFDTLRQIANDPRQDARERLRAHLVLIEDDPDSAAFIVEQLPQVKLADLPVVRDALQPALPEVVPILWNAAQAANIRDEELLRLAACLAYYDARSQEWLSINEPVSIALLSAGQFEIGEWANALYPASDWLIQPLESSFLDASLSASTRDRAAGLLARFAADRPELLARWIAEADVEQFSMLLDPLRRHPEEAIRHLQNQLSEGGSTQEREVRRRARAALALMHLNRDELVMPFLEASASPEIRTELIALMKPFGVPKEKLIENAQGDHAPSVRSALLLALGEYAASGEDTPPGDVVRAIQTLYQTDPDGGVHSAAEWLSHQWDMELNEITPNKDPQDPPSWWINTQGQTMIGLKGPIEFTMGSRADETARDPIEGLQTRVIGRSYAISAHEVTIDQYLRFTKRFKYAKDVAKSADCPINKTNWFDAIRYCRWLSEQESIPESEMCYPAISEIDRIEKGSEKEGEAIEVSLPEDLLSRSGYRLPTEAEWEYAARGGAATAWHFGRDSTRLADYCTYLPSSDEHTWPVHTTRPNSFGLFGVHGNVQEWCHTKTEDVPASDELATALGSGADVRPSERFVRGGYYGAMTRLTRSAKRFSYPARTRVSFMGFRVVRTLKTPSDEREE